MKSSYTFRTTSTNTSTLVSNYTSTVIATGTNSTTSYAYTYDCDGNITQIVDGNGKKTSYAYDDQNQLIRENIEAQNKTYVYTYDNAGNRTSKKTYAYTTSNSLDSLTCTEETYTYGNAWGDQLTQVGTTTITYDEIGNPETFKGYDLTWHGRQLKEMEKTNSVIQFLYNADGIRTSKIVNGIEHIYTLNGSQIVSEVWGNNLLIYLYDENGSPIGMQYRNGSYAADTFFTFFFEKNLQGDIIAIYNENGVKVLSYTYDAWGNHTTTWHYSIGTNMVAQYNPFRYRGYYYDTETGWYYLQSRYYNPAWGRFLNEDGLIYSHAGLIGYNMYAYCGNEPVLGYDPTGYDDLTYECNEDDGNPINDWAPVRGSNAASAGPGTGMGTGAGTGTGWSSSYRSNVASIISNDIINLPRVGHALKTDPHHAFPDIIDNYAGYATVTSINNGTLYQIEGSLNGIGGRFEWICQNGQVTHRMFVKDGSINGIPIKP